MKESTESKDELNLMTLAQEYADEDKARGWLEQRAEPERRLVQGCFKGFA